MADFISYMHNGYDALRRRDLPVASAYYDRAYDVAANPAQRLAARYNKGLTLSAYNGRTQDGEGAKLLLQVVKDLKPEYTAYAHLMIGWSYAATTRPDWAKAQTHLVSAERLLRGGTINNLVHLAALLLLATAYRHQGMATEERKARTQAERIARRLPSTRKSDIWAFDANSLAGIPLIAANVAQWGVANMARRP